ncbi:MAG: dehydrogenase, partial [Leptospiraceae bacterium]|nr:dehydrogenase [Leptospiraceae bacterium]
MKVFISTYPFGTSNRKPLEILEISNIPYTLNPYKRKLKPNETLELARDYEILIAGTEDLTPLIKNSTRLKFISRVGIGLDSVPLELCKEKGIQVSFTPDAVTPAVVELTIGLMLDGLRKISFADREIRKGIWTRPIGKRIGESIIGIIGFGRVGSGVAKTLIGFSPKQIFVNDIIDVSEKIKNLKNLGLKIEFSSFDEILEKSNILTLHVPLTPLTKNMIYKETISKMQNFPLLINTSRG